MGAEMKSTRSGLWLLAAVALLVAAAAVTLTAETPKLTILADNSAPQGNK
jgi:hypothetical protein